jgi:DNA-binding NarL/FixJ family response regulator
METTLRNENRLMRVLIADDHAIFRDGLRSLLEAEGNYKVIGKATDGIQAVELARELNPDILLLDLFMPRYSGLAALRDLAGLPAPVRTIVLAAAVENRDIVESFELGARAVVLKEWATKDLLQAIRTVLAGQYWIGGESVAAIAQALQELRTRDTRKRPFGLTLRELEIIELIATGYRNKEIAEKFSISEQTVKHHLTNIFNKLGVSTRLELALFAVNHGLGETESLATAGAPSF